MCDTNNYLESANGQTTLGPGGGGGGANENNNELQAILSPALEICLLRDSPFRILRVSESGLLDTVSWSTLIDSRIKVVVEKLTSVSAWLNSFL